MAFQWTDKNKERLLACTSDEEMVKAFPTHKLVTLKRNYRHYAAEAKVPNDKVENLRRLNNLLEEHGVDIDDIGSLKSVRLSNWEMMSKDAEGEPQVTKLKGAAVLINPKWAEGPEWPLPQVVNPVSIAPIKVKPVRHDRLKTAVLLPDMQIWWSYILDLDKWIPFHDPNAINVALQVLRYISESRGVDTVVVMGDAGDFPSMSRFAQSPHYSQTHNRSMQTLHEVMAQIRAITPGSRTIYIEGNHEKRLQTYTAMNAEAAFGMKQVGETWPLMSVPHVCRFEELGVEYLDGYPNNDFMLNNNLKLTHGRHAKGSKGTMTTVLRDERHSLIQGHTHRIEERYLTFSSNDGGKQRLAATIGCLCRIDGAVPSYFGSTGMDGIPMERHEDWQHGLAVVDYAPGDGEFFFDQLYINTFSGYTIRYDGRTFRPDKLVELETRKVAR